MSVSIARNAQRTLWGSLLVVWTGLAMFWTWRLLKGGWSGSDFGSLSLAIGSAFLALSFLDPARRGRWLGAGAFFIGVSLVALYLTVQS